MNFDNNEFTLLSEEQVFGKNKIDVISKLGEECALTDFAILLGASVSRDCYIEDDNSLKGRTGSWYLACSYSGVVSRRFCFRTSTIHLVDKYGGCCWCPPSMRNGVVRPVLPFSNINNISLNGVMGRGGFLEVEYGEYPQYAVDMSLSYTLEKLFKSGTLRKTGKTYTTDSRRWDADSERFQAIEHEEFQYRGKKYVRVKPNTCIENGLEPKLTNGYTANDRYIWLEVSPLKWIVDEREKLLVCKNAIASGIRFFDAGEYVKNFKDSEMYTYLNTYFAKDIVPSVIKKMTPEEKKQLLEELKTEMYTYLNAYFEKDIISIAIKEMTPEERKQQFEELKKEIIRQASTAGSSTNRDLRQVENIGTAKSLIY